MIAMQDILLVNRVTPELYSYMLYLLYVACDSIRDEREQGRENLPSAQQPQTQQQPDNSWMAWDDVWQPSEAGGGTLTNTQTRGYGESHASRQQNSLFRQA